MADFVNKVKTKDNKEYAINDKRIPEITLGDTEKVLGVNENGNYDFIVATGTDNLKNLLNGEITEISYEKTIDHIPAYLANNVPSLTNISLNGIKNGIGSYAFMNSEYLSSIDLGKVDGEIGDHAFAGLVNVNHFYIDPESEITGLGHSVFAGIGMDRNSAERFVFDFRNSSFKDFEGFGTPDIPGPFDSATQTNLLGILGIGMTNADIYLPETVESFMKYGAEGEGSNYGYSSGSDNGVLHNCTNIDLYITGKEKVIPLKDLETLPTDDESHIFVPNEIFGKYAIATNWAAYENLIDYIDNSVDQAILPLYDVEGYELSWYKDKALTDPTTLGTGNTVYAIKTGERLMSKVVLGEAYKGSIEITTDESTYEPDQLIPVGTEITITPISNEPGEPILSLFKVNGEVCDGATTITLTEANIIVDVYYNVPELPDYLRLVGPYGSQSDNLTAIEWNYGFSGEVPSNIDIMPFYIKNNRAYIVKDCYAFRTALQDKDYYVTLSDTIEEFRDYCFDNCTGIKSINIPNKLKYINYQAFHGCSNLETIGILPKSVNYIQAQAFGACPNLTNKNIYYEGKPGDLSVLIYEGSPDSESNKPFKDALCYYSEEMPTDCSGQYKYWHYVAGEPIVWPEPEHEPMDPVQENYVLPTCEEDGGYDEVIYCKQCYKEFSRDHIVIPALGHEWGNWEVVEEPIGCKSGLKHRICQHNSKHVQEEAIPAPEDHTAGNIVEENRVEPTYEADGSYDAVVYCLVCGEEVSRNHVVIPHLEHNYSSEWSYDENTHWQFCIDEGYENLRGNEASHTLERTELAPTYLEPGSITDYCPVCGYKNIVSKVDPLIVNDLSFEQDTSSGEYIINGYSGSSSEIKIPRTYNSIKIKKVLRETFINNADLTSVTLFLDMLNGLSSSDLQHFFDGCSSLVTLNIIVENIDDWVKLDRMFKFGLNSQIEVHLINNIGSELINIEVGKETVDSYAFRNCAGIKNVVFSEGVKYLGQYVFDNCTELETIYFPSTIVQLGGALYMTDWISRSPKLKSIAVSAENWTYASIDGMLCNKDKTLLIMCPSATTGKLVIADSFTSIGRTAFNNCKYLTEIIFNENINYIDHSSLSSCTALQKVSLPLKAIKRSEEDSGSYISYYPLGSIFSTENAAGLLETRQSGYTGDFYSTQTRYIPAALTEVVVVGSALVQEGFFQNCVNITNVTLCGSINTIRANAFSGCTGLQVITYLSAMEDWNSINFATNWRADSAVSVIHCTDGDIQLD